MRTLAILTAFIGAWLPASATTLQQLGLGEMARKSTAIARVRVVRAEGVLKGSDVYTVYHFETLESLKASATGMIHEVAVPGGIAAGLRQVVAGAPSLRVGNEYVLFLWTSRSGLTQIIGLSQGVFSASPGRPVDAAGGNPTLTRAAAGEQMLDAGGRPVHDEPLEMTWTELKQQVRAALRVTPVTTTAFARNQ